MGAIGKGIAIAAALIVVGGVVKHCIDNDVFGRQFGALRYSWS